MDYDYNAPSPEYLAETHFRFYKTYRARRPETPIVMISKPSMNTTQTISGERDRKRLSTAREKRRQKRDFIDGSEFSRMNAEIARGRRSPDRSGILLYGKTDKRSRRAAIKNNPRRGRSLAGAHNKTIVKIRKNRIRRCASVGRSRRSATTVDTPADCAFADRRLIASIDTKNNPS
ncbi:MAG: hypothetical protein ACLUSP_10070 [Christensenellales bacterium]